MDFSIPPEYAELQRNLTDFVDRELKPLEAAELDLRRTTSRSS